MQDEPALEHITQPPPPSTRLTGWNVLLYVLLLAPGLRGLLANNADLALMSAEWIDSGSIVTSLLELTESSSFYNYSATFHTRVYGGSFYFFIFWPFAFYKWVVGIHPSTSFPVFAVTARLVTLAFSVLALILLQRLSFRLTKSKLASIAIVVATAAVGPFVTFSYEVHPEPAGMACSIAAFLGIHAYFETGRVRYILGVLLAITLGALSKQAFGLMAVPSAMAAGIALRDHLSKGGSLRLSSALKLIGMGVGGMALCVLVFNPYLLFSPRSFLDTQLYLKALHGLNGRATLAENMGEWFSEIISADYVLLMGLIASVVTCGVSLTKSSPAVRTLRLVAVYNIAFTLWLTASVYTPRTPLYFYPIYPFLVLVVVYGITFLVQYAHSSPVALRRRVAAAAAVGMVLAQVLIFFRNTLEAVDTVARSVTFKHTDAVRLRDALASQLEGHARSVLHSVSIPLQDGASSNLRNTFQLGSTAEDMSGHLNNLQPELMVLDITKYWPFEQLVVQGKYDPKLVHRYEIRKRFPDLPPCRGLTPCIVSLKRRLNAATLSSAEPSSEQEPFAVVYSRQALSLPSGK
ncbi:glycosyltransferase family 39 protein [Hyalangium sp.]|uniref:glycosyltransferase family 39 protein n=1 Tax=Hyalangium sp. TaxID=2028555 RepID=UPI002D59DC4D|nr:glycosyltransferase family 39 protein [Hyalangium sp.]HYH97988.1 glycosyltransferase family 39 protein [Hyalangium sp.]